MNKIQNQLFEFDFERLCIFKILNFTKIAFAFEVSIKEPGHFLDKFIIFSEIISVLFCKTVVMKVHVS